MTKKLFFLLILLTSFIGVANAQVTTSAISGKVISGDETVIGASVVAVHQPSGTKYGTVTNEDGRYTLQGLRTGGPYTVVVSFLGYKDAEFSGITLQLGNTFSQNVTLTEDSQFLDEVVVVADVNVTEGASKNFSVKAIESVPTVDRNIYDVVKNMPMVGNNKTGGISFAGSNNRYNSFQIDGTVSNDVFGLSSGGTNGDQSGANPISMEAIQEIQVVIAPFDVRQSGFTGGGINAVTKQGDNTFKASAYTYYNNQNLYGRYNAYKEEKEKLGTQSTLTYGASVGGAIIKDKLFYYVNVEKNKETYPTTIYPGYTSDYLTADMAQQIADKYYEYTGNSEAYEARSVDRESLGLLARVDWNINDKHKLAVRYQGNNSYKDSYSPSAYTYYFNNSGYQISNKTNSFVAELASSLSDNLHNEFRVSASYVRDARDVAYDGPCVSITGTESTNYTGIYIGTEYSSGANFLNQDVYTVEDNLSLYKGNHTITFGTHNEFYKIQNMFIQAAYGAWYFDSVEDFLNDDPSKFIYKYTDPEEPTTGGSNLWTPVMNFAQFGIYAQDEWVVNNNFTLTYGLRFDMPVAFNSPTTNDTFNAYALANGLDANVGSSLSSKLMVSPRVGFRWYADNEHKTLVRGGAGLFTGRVPFVWLSNSYTNTGIEQKGTTIYGSSSPSLGDYANDPYAGANSATGSASVPDIVTVDKDFKFPQVFRLNLALEQRLPGNIKATLEGIYSKTLNNVLFENLALTQNGTIEAIEGVAASAVPFYENNTGAYSTIVNLKNTNKGYSYALSASLDKRFDFGLDLNGSYTYGRSMSVNDGTSSVAYSNWKYNYSCDPNSGNELGFSAYDVPHRVVLQASYTTPKYFNGLMQTNVSLIYNGYSGSRYSLTVSDASWSSDFNGDGYGGNSLLYIPTESELEKMVFVATDSYTADDQRAMFESWIQSDKYASSHRGQYAERNSNLTPWENRLDLHIAQDIFYMKDAGRKLQVIFDVVNFTNMLNKNWGASWSAPYTVSPVKVTRNSDNSVTYQINTASTVDKSDIYSRWQAQVGLRITF